MLWWFSKSDNQNLDATTTTTEFQPGQAHRNYTTTTTTTTTTTKPSPSNSIDTVVNDEENVQLVVDDMTNEIHQVEMEQLDQVGQDVLDSTTTKISNKLRIGIGKLFGSTLSSEEVEDVAVQVQTQLNTEAKSTLRGKADVLTQNAISNLETMVSTEEENGYDAIEIEEDVYDDERQAVNAMKVGIHVEATHVQQSLSARATEIEKAILEERLSAKLGKRVKLVIEEDEVRPMEGDDELFHGLHALAPPTTTPSTTSTKPKGATVTTTTTTQSSSSVYGKNSTSATHPVSTTTSTYNKNGKNSTSATHFANPIRTGNTTTNTTTSVKPNSDGTSARVNTGTQSATTSTINTTTTTTMTTTNSKGKTNKKSSDVKSNQNKQGSKTKNNPSKF
jgi:hypothetical protein